MNTLSNEDKEIRVLEWKLEFTKLALSDAKEKRESGLCSVLYRLDEHMDNPPEIWTGIWAQKILDWPGNITGDQMLPLSVYKHAWHAYFYKAWEGEYGIKRVELLQYLFDNITIEDFIWEH